MIEAVFFYIKCQLWLEKSSSHSLTHSPINVTFRKSRKYWTSLNSSYASDILALPSHSLLASWYPFFIYLNICFKSIDSTPAHERWLAEEKAKQKKTHKSSFGPNFSKNSLTCVRTYRCWAYLRERVMREKRLVMWFHPSCKKGD